MNRSDINLKNPQKGLYFELTLAQYLSIMLKAVFVPPSNALAKYAAGQLQLLQKNDLNLAFQIQQWAKVSAKNLYSTLLPFQIRQVIWVAQSKDHQDLPSETDLLFRGDKDFYLSLKLFRSSSYVNTKSAGMKTFLTKYFSGEVSEILQHAQNAELALLHQEMLEHIHGYYQKKMLPVPRLPGDLDPLARDYWIQFLIAATDLLHRHFQREEIPLRPEDFARLCGGDPNYQLHQWWWSEDDEWGFLIAPDYFLNAFSSEQNIKVMSKKTYLEWDLPDFIFQIRPKAMNSFWQNALKVNCSVKFKQVPYTKKHLCGVHREMLPGQVS